MAYTKKSFNKEEYAKEKDAKMADFLNQRAEAIIASLESKPENTPIWESPIFHNKYINPASNVRYNSSNAASLYTQVQHRTIQEEQEEPNKEYPPFFMTYAQAKKNGLQVKKGSKAFAITKNFGKKIASYDTVDENGKEEKKDIYRSAVTFDSIFNINDLEGDLSEKIKRNMDISFSKATNSQAQVVLQSLIDSSPVKVRRIVESSNKEKDSSSFYVPSADFVNVPPSLMFKDVMEEISTIAHEIAHSWGHPSRLNRESLEKYSTDIAIRAEEEIVANVAAQAVIQHFGVEVAEQERMDAFSKNHDVYDFGWANRLKNQPDVIIRAINAADKTASRIIESIEMDLTQKIKDNPSLDVPEFIKERILKRENDLESDNTLAEPAKKKTYTRKYKK